MLVANSCHGADLSDAAKHLGSDIGTVRVVAQILAEQLFAPVPSFEARLDDYLRNRISP